MALDPNRWTAKTTEAVRAAMDTARERSNPEVTPDHLVAALLGQEGTVTLPVLQRVGVAPARTCATAPTRPWPAGPTATAAVTLRPRPGPARRHGPGRLRQREAMGDEYLSVEHLLLALPSRIGVPIEDLR